MTSARDPGSAGADAAGRQLIMVCRPSADRELLRGVLQTVLPAGATVGPLVPAAVGDLAVFHHVAAADEALDALAVRLRRVPGVEGAYVKPATELPVLNAMQPAAATAPGPTPDLTARQGYLDAAPAGIDARHAWTLPGGRGAGVKIIDIEGGWNFDHEDLRANKGGVIGGTPYPGIEWRNHGTAVVGEVGGDDNDLGVTGICSDAHVSAVSHGGHGSAAAIKLAADALGPGDILLIEAHRPGPRFRFRPQPDQRGYIPIEWWPDDLAAIQYAAGRGVIVVAAAGNGAEDLDDPLYDVPAPGFPAGWVNPLRREVDSGAILVGAGAPPPGTHGRGDHGPDRSKLEFSNYGSIVDAQGWGREVTTTGYGDLQSGKEDRYYTDRFAGTSSASPIVVGALGCVQGARRARGDEPLTPAQARAALRAGGSPQQDGPGCPAERFRIGARPDLRRLLAGRAALPLRAVTPLPGADAGDYAWLVGGGGGGLPDLHAVRLRNTRSGAVEVLVLAGADRYGRVARRAVTAIPLADAAYYAWALGDHGDDRGGVPDLYALRVRGTASGHVEVTVLAGASGYRSPRLGVATPIALADAADYAWAVADHGGDGVPDLYALRVRGATAVEVHVLNGADDYQTFALRTATPLAVAGSGGVAWAVGAPGARIPDVYGFAGAGAVVEARVLAGADRYQTVVRRVVPAVAGADAADYAWALAACDGVLRVCAVRHARTASGRVEVHVFE